MTDDDGDQELDRDCLIQETVSELVGWRPAIGGLMPKPEPRLDVSKPNIHDNKAEFLRELAVVEAAQGALRETLSALLPNDSDTNVQTRAMVDRLRRAIDASVRRRRSKLFPTTVSALVRRITADAGHFDSVVWALLDLGEALTERLNELKDQETQFWSVNHRPANHYARTIAVRLARIYARAKGAKPTVGTARDGCHPSTDYGRALERIFNALGIKASVKNPATWAVDQLTEQDLEPNPFATLGSLFGQPAEKPSDPMRGIIEALARREGN